MQLEKTLSRKILHDGLLSLFLYALPVLLMLLVFYINKERPWETYHAPVQTQDSKNFITLIFQHLSTWGLPLITLIVGVVEFAYGLYETKWNKNERILDIVCFVVPKIFSSSIYYLCWIIVFACALSS